MAMTLLGLIRSDIRRILAPRQQKAGRRLQRRLAALESRLRALTVAVRELGRRERSARVTAAAGGAPNGDEIRALRERMRLTRQVFAKRLNVSPSIIFLWEAGRSRPSRRANVDALKALFRASGRGSGKGPQGVDGQSIRDARAQLGLSRDAFAKRAGVSPSMTFLWETGRSAPRRRANVETLQALIREASGAGASARSGTRRKARKQTL
jgi:DNA-binding transcriptional regulator YiaG